LDKRLTGSLRAIDCRESHPRLAALVEQASALPALPTAVVFPHDVASLQSAVDAANLGLIAPIFYGDETRIREVAALANLKLTGAIKDTGESAASAASAAVADAGCGRVRALMKGSLHTDELLAPVVARDSPIRGFGRTTHTFIFDLPRYHKLLAVTDAVINITPDVPTKKEALLNAVRLLECLGVTSPKVAIVAAVETVTAKIQATVDAAALVAMAGEGHFGSAVVEGPFGFDNAISAVAARAKGLVSVVAGDPDVLLVPDLNSGNMLYKSFVYVGGGECAGLVQGALVPIILTSRADSWFARIASCALAGLASSTTRR
jgi:phosphate acetyltransferase